MSSRIGRNPLRIISCFILLFFISPFCCSQQRVLRNTLVPDQQLKDGQHLVSASGNYRLGFFSGPRRNRYLGIQHIEHDDASKISTDSTDTWPVWVANRNNPIGDNSGVFTVSGDGSLKISNAGEDVVIASGLNQSLSKIINATLENTGNFVVNGLNSNGSLSRLWQSFDYPTDTLLPGMKIGINTETGQNWNLTSWLSENDPGYPGIGSFTLGIDPKSKKQLIIWYQKEIYWVSGLWDNGIFTLPNELSMDVYYHFNYSADQKEKYFTFFVYEDVMSFQRLTLDPGGALMGMQMDKQLHEFISCPKITFSDGCFGIKDHECGLFSSHFDAARGVVYAAGYKFYEGEGEGENCKEKCLNNCHCYAYASTNPNNTGCEIWSEGNFRMSHSDHSSRYIYRRRHLYDPQFPFGKLSIWWITIATIGGLITLVLLYYFISTKSRAKGIGGILVLLFKTIYYLIVGGKTNKEQKILIHELQRGDGKKSQELQFFSFESIASATNNFVTTNKLGEGGFGAVYKGQLPDGQEVAIKRLSRNSGQGLMEFKNEAILIAKLQHTNLVRLVGCCIHKEEKMLIYEYMPNKSLNFFLFDPVKKSILDWKKRFNIIQGIVQGILYLHNYSRLRIIHRDLKASNILLDTKMNPKISDFGMAKIFGSNDFEAETSRIVGTPGYMSPEYYWRSVYSTKSDVFSFGVLLLEIVSGRKNYRSYRSEPHLNLIGHAWELWGEDRGLELIDPTLGDSNYIDQVLRCMHVSLLCVQENPVDRPDMLDVIHMIYNEANKLPAPKQPAFFIRKNIQEAEIVECRPENCSSNKMSISEMLPR